MSVRIRKFCSCLAALLLISSFAFAAAEAPQTFTLDGRLYGDANSTAALVDSSIVFKVQIFDENRTCILYEEQQSISTLTSNGYFSASVGSVTGDVKRTSGDTGNTMASVFQNSSNVNGKLPSNGSTCTVTATAGKKRYARITISPSTKGGTPRVLSPDIALDSVPNAVVAERAESVQGVNASQILQVNTSGSNVLSQANLENVFTSTARFNALTALVDGTSTAYMKTTSAAGAALPVVAGSPSTPVAGSIWYDSTDSTLKYQTGVGTQTLSTGGGGSLPANGGTATAPGYAFSGDSNTGVYSSTADTVGISTGGSARVFVDASGNVGIGTTSPSALLNVNGTEVVSRLGIGLSPSTGTYLQGAGSTTISNSGVNGADLTFYVQPSGSNPAFVGNYVGQKSTAYYSNASINSGSVTAIQASAGIDGSGGSISKAYGLNSSVFNNGSTFTSAYAGSFDILSNSGTITNGYGVYIGTISATNKFSLYTSDSSAPSYFAGSVGIGTTSPARLLHVAGPMRMAASPLPSSPSAGDMAVDSGDSNKLKWYDGSAWQNAGGGGGAPSGSAGGDLSGTYPNPTVAKIQGVAVSSTSPTAGQVLSYSSGSTSWVPTNFSVGSLLTAAGAQQFSGSSSCAANQTLTWSSLTNTFTCANIAGLDGGVITSGTISASRLPADASAWTTSGSDIYRSSGNVGIGTTSPTSPLQVNATLNQATGNETAIALNYTVNKATSGNDSGLLINMTDTASPGASTLLDVKRNGTSIFSVTPGILGVYVPIGMNHYLTPTTANDVSVDSSSVLWTADKTAGSYLGFHADQHTNFINTNQAIGFKSDMMVVGSGGAPKTLTDYYNFYAASPTSALSGAVTNQYGLYVEDLTLAANKFAVYTAGTTPSYFGGNVGIGIATPSTTLDINGGITARGIATGSAPATAAGQGKIYFDSTANKFKVSENNGAYVDLVGGGGGGGAATSVSASAGSAASPSVSFSSDTDTGFFSSASNAIGVSAGGSSIFTFSSSGLVSSTTGGASVTTAAGNASAPTYSFAGDTGTGWFRAAASTLAASTGGTERIRIDPSGNVGIGTTAPFGVLHSFSSSPLTPPGVFQRDGSEVNPIGYDTEHIVLYNADRTDNNYAAINFKSRGSSGSIIRQGPSIRSIFTNHAQYGMAGDLSFQTSNTSEVLTERLRITSAGNVGIGTTSPTQKLSVSSTSAGSGLLITNGTNAVATLNGQAGGGDNGSLSLWNAGSPGLSLTASGSSYLNGGSVGIGTTAPTTKLTVAGSANSPTNAIATGGAVNLALSNNHLLKSIGGTTIALSNLVDGSTHTLYVADTTSRTYTFTGCSNTYFNPANGPTTGRSTYTVSVVVDGANTDCWINWSTGFN